MSLNSKFSELPIVLLAGGLGTRLTSVVSDAPKILAPVDGVPFLEFLLRDIHSQGFGRVILSLCHKAEMVSSFIQSSGWSKRMSIDCIVEERLLGTGGALKFVLKTLRLEGAAIVANGDTMIDHGWTDLVVGASGHDGGVLGLTKVLDSNRYGTVLVDHSGLVTDFKEKGPGSSAGLIYSGVSLLTCESILSFDGEAFSLEKDILPKQAALRKLRGVLLPGNFIDIGIPEDYQRFCERVRSGKIV